MKTTPAVIAREYGPFEGASHVHGVSFDGSHVWFAAGDKLVSFRPADGAVQRTLAVAAHAGTAFDGRHFFQIAEDRIQKLDPETGAVLATIPAPGGGGDSGLTWAEGTLWVGHYRNRKIHQIDPETGAVLRTIESDRFVTGVTWVDDELWHGTWEADASDLRLLAAIHHEHAIPLGIEAYVAHPFAPEQKSAGRAGQGESLPGQASGLDEEKAGRSG